MIIFGVYVLGVCLGLLVGLLLGLREIDASIALIDELFGKTMLEGK